VFVGEPVEVVRKPIEYEIKTNGENDPMKELIINALQAGKPTEGKSDAELMDAYNQLSGREGGSQERRRRRNRSRHRQAEKEQASNSEEAPAWFKPFADDLAAVKSGLP
jgi:hypothetical protein